MSAVIFLVIGAGYHASSSIRSSSGYSLSGRSAKAPFVAGSIAGTIIGGGATAGTAQLAYSQGLSGWWFTLGSGIAFIIMGLFYARRLRETSLVTIPEFLSLHYGKTGGLLASVISSLGILLSALASALPGIEIISSLFRISPVPAAFLLMILVILYTLFGGMKGAAVEGLLKTAILFISLFAAGGYALYFLMTSPDIDTIPLRNFHLFGNGLSSSLSALFSVIIGILCTQTYIQCIFSALTPKEAAKGCFLAALITIPVGLPSVAAGMYMSVAEPSATPILVLPLFLIHYAPPLIAGLALGGIVLSLLGSIGGLSLGIGTMISKDILPYFIPMKDDKKTLLITRMSVLSVMILSFALAIMNRGSEILFWNYLSMALRGGGIFLPFTLAIFFPHRLEKSRVLISMAGSTAVSLLSLFLPEVGNPLFPGLMASFLLLLPGIRFRKNSHVSRETK